MLSALGPQDFNGLRFELRSIAQILQRSYPRPVAVRVAVRTMIELLLSGSSIMEYRYSA